MDSNYKLSLIVAMTERRVIGDGEKIPWRIPEDQQLFKKITIDHPVIMGRKTYQTLPRPLIGRRNLVVSRNPDSIPLYKEPDTKNNGDTPAKPKVRTLETASSLADAIEKAAAGLKDEHAERFINDELFVIGGAQIYSLALPMADRLYISRVHEDYEGDILFPDFDRNEWPITETRVFEEFTLEIRDRKS